MKVLINKEDFGIVDRFLVRWEFDFWVLRLVKCLILVGFDDMGYDKGFEKQKWDFCLILLRFYEGWIFELVCG